MIRKGTRVVWNWGRSKAQGKVKEIIKHDATKTIKGSKVKRKGSEAEPVYIIEQDDGDEVLKSCSEIKRAS
jgi:hypothetical protein